ncbi:hypothetical protein H8959_002015 [Pygathrix nigripes]
MDGLIPDLLFQGTKFIPDARSDRVRKAAKPAPSLLNHACGPSASLLTFSALKTAAAVTIALRPHGALLIEVRLLEKSYELTVLLPSSYSLPACCMGSRIPNSTANPSQYWARASLFSTVSSSLTSRLHWTAGLTLLETPPAS